MPASHNDDFLSRVQLTACAYLSADPYISGAPEMPVISEVKGDLLSAIEKARLAPVRIIVGFGDLAFETGGGAKAVKSLALIVRVLEQINLNRAPGGTGENALRIAQKIAHILDTKTAARASDAAATRLGGTLSFRSIEQALPDNPDDKNQAAWHVNFQINGGALIDFTRRQSPPVAGSP